MKGFSACRVCRCGLLGLLGLVLVGCLPVPAKKPFDAHRADWEIRDFGIDTADVSDGFPENVTRLDAEAQLVDGADLGADGELEGTPADTFEVTPEPSVVPQGGSIGPGTVGKWSGKTYRARLWWHKAFWDLH